ncbi:S9 family peptidase [Psychroserpens algicola]|uniref:S9 family peptidase n=1 Tax=Psychroserpens algicola TaxID=1719034 RepID=A0ABT0H809_9FLAO|nr:alpha/beta fold hydrolase [Psychroserpens algicola]MCK8480500.1 S9 family peptidase [Psychroserpens algicola]
MNILKSFMFIVFFVTTLVSAQQKEIALEEIWNDAFKTEKLTALHSMKNGKQYSVLNSGKHNSQIDIYDYKTLTKVATLVSSEQLEGIEMFSDYKFSDDEKKVLLATDVESIYRHSNQGYYYVYDTVSEKLMLISEAKIQEPTFSPDGTKVAYGLNNNIYYKDLDSGKTTQLTYDGEKNKIINGITDWVYEEEFAFVKAFEWNATGSKIAFLRFNEEDVPEFSMDIYGQELYPTQQVFKYPKAGEVNSEVSLHVYDLASDEAKEVVLTKAYADYYIPRFKWTNDANVLSAQFMNRHQNELDLWLINAENLKGNLVLAETDTAYIDVTSNLTFLKDNSFIWTSETDGYNHIYHYDKSGTLINQVTSGNWEVTSYYGYDTDTERIFYQSTEDGSINRSVYSVKLNGKQKKRLTNDVGTNSAAFSTDFTYFINTYSSTETPTVYTLNNAKTGDVIKPIIDNDKLVQKLSDYDISTKEFSTIKINGYDLNMWTIKPSNFDASKTYPLLMFQYSGPGSQKVANSWNGDKDYWHQHLAQQGYIIACVDGRGTGFKGAAFKKVTQNELGKYEVEDQIATAKQLAKLPYIDEHNIGIWGWSYGGFMSSNALLKGNDTFSMAIAVAPVTSWRFYDTIYTERYMKTPEENPSGYDENSPINHVDKLEGAFLLIHGSGDDNVHVQNTMRMVEALVQADKQFEWMIYPDKKHSINTGENTKTHLYKKMTRFIHDTLGKDRKSQKESENN